MGNAESSSSFEFPRREEAGLRSAGNSRARRPGEEEESSSSVGKALKFGAAAAGTALLALGAWNLGKSLSSDESDSSKPAQGGSSSRPAGDHSYSHYGTYKQYSDKPKPYQDRMREIQNLNARIIKVMSYNVWSNEEVELHERMKEIGRLIQQHDPDVIFFQEITPSIYDVFESSSWWKAYKCSVSSLEATRKYFCMLLTKLPAKKYYPRFSNSMGRELCAAQIDFGWGRKLIVATSHLASPTPQVTRSTERVAQAKIALDALKNAPNVVFGGDMNWDEEVDGPLPLLDGWVDAWNELRPGEEGWTFDTNSNRMLNLNKPLQKRLDRFICKLINFRLIKVDMIGMEAIPGLFYDKKQQELPVLPSDHYGLLLTISLI